MADQRLASITEIMRLISEHISNFAHEEDAAFCVENEDTFEEAMKAAMKASMEAAQKEVASTKAAYDFISDRHFKACFMTQRLSATLARDPAHQTDLERKQTVDRINSLAQVKRIRHEIDRMLMGANWEIRTAEAKVDAFRRLA